MKFMQRANMFCRSLFLAVLAVFLCGTSSRALPPEYKHEFIYQIVTDRFCNGRSDNDEPPQSKGLFDASHTNWHAYWGGDLAGIRQKLDYIKRLGATAIWISPAVDNINKPTLDADQKMMAPYHGYWARDFKRVEEHFGDPANSWREFDLLTKAAHQLGMKVIVDLPANHTSEYNHGEYGALYDDGHFKCEFNYDKMKYFHHLPQLTDWNDRYQLQYYT
ncbi:MAG: alpha-amylase family glycosyl hydrolase, partial [Terriglobales bacterium]